MQLKLTKVFPFLDLLKIYNKKDFVADLIAGTVLAIILLPKSIAYASIAGLPPVYGLYAAILSPAIGALWGSSRHLSTGPAAVISFLVFASVAPLAGGNSDLFISLAILLAFIVGFIQLFMGIFKAGFVMNFVSHSVILGFVNAAALIIAVTQFKDLFGIKIGNSDIFFETVVDIIKHVPDINFVTLGIGIVSILIIIFGKKIHKFFPGGIVAVILFTLLAQKFGWDHLHHVKIVGDIPTGIPFPSFPKDLSFSAIFNLFPVAFVISIIGFVEALSIAKSIGAKTKQKIDINQELIGQGLANIFTGLFKGYPVSGSFSGTAVNYSAGGRTAISNVIASFFIIVILLFFVTNLTFLPKAVLAAIVIVAVIGLFHPKEMFHLYKINKFDGITAFITFFAAFMMKLDYAIFLGIILSLVLFIYKTVRPNISILARSKELNKFICSENNEGLESCPQIIIIRPEMSLYFANIEFVIEKINTTIRKNPNLKYILIESSSINTIDGSAIHALVEFFEEVERTGVKVKIINLKTSLKKALDKAGITEKIGKENFVMSKSETIQKLTQEIDQKFCKKCPLFVFNECEKLKK